MISDSSNAPLLTIRGLRIEGKAQDAWTPIVKGVDLTVKRGEVFGLIGESGAGKSTIGLAAMGFVRDGCRFAGGSVLFDGIELIGAPRKVRLGMRSSRIAYVAQSAAASFNPAFRLIDQHGEFPVLRGLMTRAEAEANAIELYRKLQLPNPDEIGFRYPHQVSGGQLQRAMTAMAMACRPDLIIFDEPTTALDVTTQIEVLSAIRDAVQSLGTAAIYVSHDLAVVAQMADKIMVLRNGETVEEAPTRTMLSSPRHDYTKSLWAVRSFRAPSRPDAEPPPPLVRIESVDAAYGAVKVLSDVSFVLPKGRTVAVVGESGSGKSTLAKVLMGLLPAKAGCVELAGKTLPPSYRERTKADLRQVQMIYQMADTALNPRQRVREIVGRPISFYLGLKGKALEARTRQLLQDMELDPDIYIDRLPSELSGGQKQRVGIARALAADPQLVICDEVTSSLDQLVAESVLKLLVRLQRERDLTYMFITHDLATVRAIADEVVVMKEGKVVEKGPKDEMFRPPHHPYTGLLLSSVPEMDPDWLTRLTAKNTMAVNT
ncbi:ABC transporter [Mesorhizobium sp. LNHC252B00]|uniref:ABC transporter ATP-binding protein n=1 Tax=Mesorhizobium sp. LNHC252B00 TaxID=1287252 RepID=UPI0003CF4A03|nr:ABC transporter ATP-binding protein [Mesorhizobium sp. LNHC252B00]ESY64907.1 ABC transporter [Mesorhizobium sp. LNHC252B00]